MCSVEEMKIYIQECFAACDDIEEIVQTYHEVLSESDKQMKLMVKLYTKSHD